MLRRLAKLPSIFKVLAVLSLTTIGAVGLSQTIGTYSNPEAPGLGAAPSGTSAGVALVPSGGYKVSVQAAANCVVVDGGTLRAWTYSTTLGTWSPEPTLDIPVFTSTSGALPPQRSITLIERGRASNPQVGRLYYQTDSLVELIPAIAGVDAGAANGDGGSCSGNVTVVLDGMDIP